GDIDFLKPAFIGDELVAHGREVVKQGRSGVYDVTVTRGDETIAVYRGRSRTLPARIPAPSTDRDRRHREHTDGTGRDRRHREHTDLPRPRTRPRTRPPPPAR